MEIEVKGLRKRFGEIEALKGISFGVKQGEVFALLGPNGAGKTTTLRLLLGLQRPTAGRAEVFGKVCGPNAVGVRSQIGYLPTNPKLPGNLRPIEYLDLLGKLCRLPAERRKPRISALLRAVGLLGATDQRIRTFSTGMCTRLGIAAALIADPPLLIWDEPTAGLAKLLSEEVYEMLTRLRDEEGITIILVDQEIRQALKIADYVYVLELGRNRFEGPVEEFTDLKKAFWA